MELTVVLTVQKYFLQQLKYLYFIVLTVETPLKHLSFAVEPTLFLTVEAYSFHRRNNLFFKPLKHG